MKNMKTEKHLLQNEKTSDHLTVQRGSAVRELGLQQVHHIFDGAFVRLTKFQNNLFAAHWV
jgi:hypothetical protein